MENTSTLAQDYFTFLGDTAFPCVAAKAALQRAQVRCFIAGDMASDAEDGAILQFLHHFVDRYRESDNFFSSAVVIFPTPEEIDIATYDRLLWQRLQALANLDARQHGYDPRVSSDPASPNFSFSLKEEACFVIGLHPSSPRAARRFSRPALVFNPHQQFETLRAKGMYDRMKHVIRMRDEEANGSHNPMLDDFGGSSEVYQYSGQIYDQSWRCPLVIPHGKVAAGGFDHYPTSLRDVIPALEGAASNDRGHPGGAGLRPDLLQRAG